MTPTTIRIAITFILSAASSKLSTHATSATAAMSQTLSMRAVHLQAEHIQSCHVSRSYRNAQDRLRCRGKTCPAHTQLVMSWKALKYYSYYYY